MVHSAPTNKQLRDTIRSTWGNVNGFKTVFLLGQVVSKDLQRDIDSEANSYGDLVQGSFMDAYRNMTLKHFMGYQ